MMGNIVSRGVVFDPWWESSSSNERGKSESGEPDRLTKKIIKGGQIMTSVKLPDSFQKLNPNELYVLVDKFVRLNNNLIHYRQKKLWKNEYRVPTLFMTLVKKSGFEFSEYSEPSIKKWKCPFVGYLKFLYSNSELIEEKRRKLLRKELAKKKRINKNITFTIYKCSNTECAHNNEQKCDTTPVNLIKNGGIIQDCNRFHEKGFKFKTWNDVLDISPER